ncbi:MFS transporter [Pimelobacter simplex]|uniref:Citrate-proton symporter n=1 Tax=Nocardioides simplex TaxID=2045 RepID=A0A0A1DJB4_NOCSI|nr:MFS transporter [Pimelobacter simplex]AIY16663.1 Citrate-proton symporter [Pimelobacter simplex]MCG8154093.1 MFS transporter [Pimelobacter simplex]GEB15499.1 MFS transporter [Pimelobacter simplex]SFM58969.1 MFS transporter, MHS family, proline/betaine transporter [Pimelobacter simplex]
MTTAPTPSAGLRRTAPRSSWRSVVAAGLGNVMEWYDVIIYAYMAPVLAVLFFPRSDQTAGLISTYAGLLISYLIRPVGAMVIGNLADKHGRKAALTLTIALMTLGVAIIAITPTYASIGLAAPAILMVSRLIQGFSAGGEFGAATTFMAESAQVGRRFLASWQAATQGMAMILAGVSGWLLFTTVDTETLHSWAWRLPFVFGILIGPIGLWIRNRIPDTEEFRATEPIANPLRTTLRDHWGRVLVGTLCVSMAGMGVYLITFLAAYALRLDLAQWSGYAAAATAGTVIAVLAPCFGRLADRIGAVPILLTAAVVGFVSIYPLLSFLLSHRSTGALILVEAFIGVVIAAYFGTLTGLLVELFDTEVRTTGIALSYNVGMIFMGSLGPLLLTAWSDVTLRAPAYYFMMIAPLSIIGVVLARKLYRQP